MAKINHPLFGVLGAFWVTGHSNPFYSLHDAKDYQLKNGGDILHWNGKLLYPEPADRQPTSPKETTNQTTGTKNAVEKKNKSKFSFFHFLGKGKK